ncbi:MAG: hypothetical protein ACLR56_14920 [Oscillospiraceae bacterium]
MLCHAYEINTCLIQAGDKQYRQRIDFTDYRLLDIKYTADEQYKKYVGCGLSQPMEFLKQLNKKISPHG